MKIYCFSWKDERWSADKETLNAINKQIAKTKKMNPDNFNRFASLAKLMEVLFSFIFYVIGWIIAPISYIIHKFRKSNKR